MNVVILGCGRVGSRLACMLDEAGHEVTVIDQSSRSFEKLPESFGGETVLGNAIDQDVLRAAGVDGADVFVAATGGDNRNIMSSQVARDIFGVRRVITRIKDPVRADIYSELGLAVDSRTVEGAQAVMAALDIEV